MKFNRLSLAAVVTAVGINKSKAVTSAPSSAPVTSAPSPAALAYNLVGDGKCLDGSNQQFSFIIFDSTSDSPAECSATCTGIFNHPHLVGFETTVQSTFYTCICLYSGGAVPSILPPQDVEYSLFNNIGNGPVMMAGGGNLPNVKCYAYAQGTASPTTPMATNAPISPSPTGTITAAPTPVGITTYTGVGIGHCIDVKGDQYSYLGKLILGSGTADECAQFCGDFPSPDLVGFESELSAFGYCYCLYSGQNIPKPPAGTDAVEIGSVSEGTGPIKGSNSTSAPSLAPVNCFAFAQGTGSPTSSPSVTSSPSGAPTITSSPTSSPSKAPVTSAPSMAPFTSAPSKAPISSSPSMAPVTSAPSMAPVTSAPSKAPVTTSPSKAPVTSTPTKAPVTSSPSKAPVTSTPTKEPVTTSPSKAPVMSAPSKAPVTSSPSKAPVTSSPSMAPVTSSPSAAPVTASPMTTSVPPTPGTPAPSTPQSKSSKSTKSTKSTKNAKVV